MQPIEMSIVKMSFVQIAGLVGIGGGEFLVPLLLHMGLEPVVASTTSGLAILFAVSSGALIYRLVFSSIDWCPHP